MAGRRIRKRWRQYEDDRILDLEMRELNLTLAGSRLEPMVDQLHEELAVRGISFRPHCWLSSEWFSPDGTPGIAIPFYLAHTRLMKLEAKQMLQVEGGTRGSCMRILRHEAGHAIDTAYRLHYRKRWRELFGNFSNPYPSYYRPNPRSKRFVHHFDGWYAQAHPAEDFAETFAVWLTPRSKWTERYRHWPVAREKLEYIDSLMEEIAGTPAKLRSRRHIEPTSSIKTTLRKHYRKRRRKYGLDEVEAVDLDLARLFSAEGRYADRPTAASFLRAQRKSLPGTVADWTGAELYTVQQLLQEMIEGCGRLKLRMKHSERTTRRDLHLMLTVRTMNFLYTRRYEIAL